MKRIISATLIALALLSRSVLAEPPYHRPPGMPDDLLVAFDDAESEPDRSIAQDLLGFSTFHWMLQVPSDARTVQVIVKRIDQDGSNEENIAVFSFDPLPPNPSERKDPLTFFPIALTAMPENYFSDNPWIESKRLIIMLTSTDLSMRKRSVSVNPFYKMKVGISSFPATQLVDRLPYEPGRWDGFGTTFRVIAGNNEESPQLHVSFRSFPQLTAGEQ